MYSLIAKTNYEIKEMIVSELRQRLINENNLTPLKILKTFVVKSKIRPNYASMISEQNYKDYHTVLDEFFRYLSSEEFNSKLQEAFDEIFNPLFQALKDVYPDATYEFVESVLAIDEKERKNKYSAQIIHIIWELTRNLYYSDPVAKKANAIISDHMNNWLKDQFGDLFIIRTRSHFNTDLPIDIDLNQPINIDFSNIYTNIKDDTITNIMGNIDLPDIRFDSHISAIKNTCTLFMPCINYLMVHIDESVAKKTFDDAINNIISNEYAISPIMYLQNLEAQPITINVNSKTGKYELIDGYKRVLYNNNEELLKITAPIRVFTDLTDEQYLALLYAANLWKVCTSAEDAIFHDRGFLFALNTRFGFSIPEKAFSHFTYTNKGLDFNSVLTVFELYDFHKGYTVNIKDEYKKLKFIDTIYSKEHFINDLTIIFNELTDITDSVNSYDSNIADEIEKLIIIELGIVRSIENNKTQKDFTRDIIESIFNDKKIVNLCSKKHLSTKTYVQNFFEKNNLIKYIYEKLLKALI